MNPTAWLLIALSMPVNGDGAIMGWSQPHPIEASCNAALKHAIVQARSMQSRRQTHFAYIRCAGPDAGEPGGTLTH